MCDKFISECSDADFNVDAGGGGQKGTEGGEGEPRASRIDFGQHNAKYHAT